MDETALHRQRMQGKAEMRFCSIVSIVRSTPRKSHAKEQGLKGVKLHARTSGRPWVGGPQENRGASLLVHQQSQHERGFANTTPGFQPPSELPRQRGQKI